MAIQQPRHRSHYNLPVAIVAANVVSRVKSCRGRWALFRYDDGEFQICRASGPSYRDRVRLFGEFLIGVYCHSARLEDIVADIHAAGG